MQFCIVTPSFNQRQYLAQTIESVLSQQGDFSVQHRVVDGLSTDGTIDLLKSNTDPRLVWTSEKDRGQSDALNRGLRQSAGDVIGWLNSDDLYTPGALQAVATAFADPRVQWVVGRYQIIDTDGHPIRSAIVRYKERSLLRYSYRKLLRENFIAQPSVFWRKDFGRQIGLVDESLHHAMDYDLWLRMGKVCDPLILDRVVSQFRIHAKSKSGTLNRERFDEDLQVAKRYLQQDRFSRWIHQLNNEKIVWAYRLMGLIGK